MKVYNDPRQHTMVVGGKLQGKWRVRKVEIVTSGPNWVRIEQNWGVFAPGEKVAKVLFANWRAAYDEAITRAGGAPKRQIAEWLLKHGEANFGFRSGIQAIHFGR